MKYIYILSIFLIGCASVQTLDGGEKDVTPPIVINVNPDSASLNVSSKEFIFQFDEYVKTTKVSDLLIISPSQILTPDLKIKGKKLFLNIKDELIPNTTYSFQFNGSIIDVNESNPLTEYSYVFSTGDYLDSLSLSGLVKHSATNQICEDCNVHLYKSNNDSVILTDKPLYTTKTNEQGIYTFYNLPDDTFNLIAIKDDNRNLVLDKEEEVSLYIIKDTKSTTRDTLYIFPLPNKEKLKPKIITPLTPGIIKLILNKTVDTVNTKLFISDTPIEYSLSQTLDSLQAFYKPNSDTTLLTIINDLDTTILDYILPLNKLKYKPKLSTSITEKSITITSNTPIKSIDTSRIKLMLDSNQIIFKNYSLTQTKVNIPIDKNEIPNQLILAEEAITDVFDKKNATDTILLNIKDITNSLVIDYQISKTSDYLIYVVKNNKNIKLNKLNTSSKIVYNNLRVGEYFIKIIEDINHNGIWDTGDLFLNKKPEPIQFSKPFEIRDNWDKELIINVL